jgi:regulator of cell morphogenesis and NO signaling
MKAASAERTLGEIVSKDYRAAALFERYGLDYCCGGTRSVGEACRMKGIDPSRVVADLEALEADDALPAAPDYDAWPAERLVEHIIATHHAYTRASLPRLHALLGKLLEVHGARHPALGGVVRHFAAMRDELEAHLFKEETILFPYIVALAKAQHDDAAAPPNIFGTVGNPIRVMEAEHQSAGNELMLVHELTRGYEVPPDGCATYDVTMRELAAFERDLFLHIHLENNILFRKAIALESQLVSRHVQPLPSGLWPQDGSSPVAGAEVRIRVGKGAVA